MSRYFLTQYTFLIVLCLSFNTISAEENPAPADIYISTKGADTNPGSREKPFATIERAQKAVRELVAAGLKKDIRVELCNGIFFFDKTLTMDAADSGTDTYSITWSGAGDKATRISGGRRITGWKKKDKNVWETTIPEVKSGQWIFEELFVNGRRATMARDPNTGYFRVVRPGKDNHTSFYYRGNDIRPYKKFEQAAVILLSEWNTSRIRIAGVNPEKKMVRFKYRKHNHPRDKYRITGFEPHPPYFVENAIELLDHPGEWYLDRDTGVLSCIPLEGDNLTEAEVIASRIDPLIQIAGNGEKGAFVKNIHFENISFEHSATLYDLACYAGSQAGNHKSEHGRGIMLAAVRVNGARKCSFRKCCFQHVGGSGLSIGRWCADNLISCCEITDCGGSAVKIGVCREKNKKAAARNTIVENCRIHDCGKRFYGCIGVWAGITDQTVIRNNHIYNMPYTAISVGWRWDPKPTPCSNNIIENNHIHHVMQKLSDGGGIYTLGAQPGTVIRENYIHDVISRHCRKHGQGIYNDMGSTGITVEGNLVRAVSCSCYQMHKAVNLVVNDNIFYGNGKKETVRFAKTKKKTVKMSGNKIIDSKRGARRYTAEGRVGTALLCDATGSFVCEPHQRTLDPKTLTLEAWVSIAQYPVGKDTRRWIAGKNAHEWTQAHFSILLSRKRPAALMNIGGGKQNQIGVSSAKHTLDLNTWHHLAMTYDGKKLVLFVDGKVAKTRDINKPRTSGKGNFCIGRRPDGMAKFDLNARIDEVVLYSRALTDEEIANRYSHPENKIPKGLVRHWSFIPKGNQAEVEKKIIEKAGVRPCDN